MGLADRDYTNRSHKVNITKRNNNLEINTKDSIQRVTHKSSSFCEYCGKEIEIKQVKETQTRSKIEKGLVIDETVEVFVEKRESLICSTCGGTFCPSCIKSFYKNKNDFVLTNICKRCQENESEEKKKNCTHNYVKRFIRKDNYFDYYELECLICSDKKRIAEPIEKIKKEAEPNPAQKRTTQAKPKTKEKNTPHAKPKSQKKGISKIVDSVKGIFR
jgi:hypothetical protein